MSQTIVGAAPRPESASAPQGQQRSVQPYDFVRPACLSREQIRTLQLLHESFAHGLSEILSPPLRLSAHVSARQVRETTYADFASGLPQCVVTGVFRISARCGPGLLAMGCDTALFMIDRLLGGSAAALPQPRWLTEIECTLMERVLGKILGAYAEAWRTLVEVSAQVQSVTSSATFTQVARPDEIVCAAEFSLELGSAMGAFSLCLPVVSWEPVLGALVLQHWLSAGRAEAALTQELSERQVAQVRIPVHAVLGGARLTLLEVARLEPGDVIRLDRGVNDEIEIIVGGRTKFFGRPGKTDGRLAVQITRAAAPGEGIK